MGRKKKTPEEQTIAFWNTFKFYRDVMKRQPKVAYANAVRDYGYHPPLSKDYLAKINKHDKIDDNWVKK